MKPDNLRVVVIGGNGFLGKPLVPLLTAKGFHVTVFDQTVGESSAAQADVSYVQGDLTNADDLDGCLSKNAISIVFHLASPNPQKLDRVLFEKVNVQGTKVIISACQRNKVCSLVYTSSASVVFTNVGLEGVDESYPYPMRHTDAYNASKMVAEQLVLEANRRGSLNTVALRPHAIFGANDPGCFAGFVDAGRKGKLKIIIGDGCNVVDFTCVENVAHAHVLAAEKLTSSSEAVLKVIGGNSYNITNDEPIRFWCFAAKIAGELGFTMPRYRMPYWLAMTVARISQAIMGDRASLTVQKVRLAGLHHWYSCEKAKKDLGYRPVMKLEEGLQKAVARAMEQSPDLRALAMKKNNGVVLPRPSLQLALALGGASLAAGSVWLRPQWFNGIPALRERILKLTPWVPIGGFAASIIWTVASRFASDRSDAVTEISTWPIIGCIPEFTSAPMKFMIKQSREIRDIFRINLGLVKIYCFTGQSGMETFFKAPEHVLSQREVYKLTVPVFGKGIIFDSELDDRTHQFHMLTGGLSERHMRTYVDLMIGECEAYFGNWNQEGEVDLLKCFSELITLTASRCLLGKKIREVLYEEVAELYSTLEEGITQIGFLAPNLPIKAHRDRNKARRKLSQIFGNVLKQRRREAKEVAGGTQSGGETVDGTETDLMEVLMKSKFADGSSPTDDQIFGFLIVVLFAGQHTSSTSTFWLLAEILSAGERVTPGLLVEQSQVGPLTFDSISNMPKLGAALTESLRLHPPLFFLMRYVRTDFAFKGRTIRKGSVVAVSPYEAGRNPDIYQSPDEYLPERWIIDDWDEWRKQYKYVSFGSGQHTCMGRRFAFLQIRCVLAVLFRNFKLEPLSPLPEMNDTGMINGPKTPYITRYKKLHNQPGLRCISSSINKATLLKDWGIDEKSFKIVEALKRF